MALRLRRDVQKASYYVWFLGAEEAKGLRGEQVINLALPFLINRSRIQEPLKVTLQVSHKGIKILQGASKHFIPHSAITSSFQTDDIVACVLLLYNPVTKCPLHVHGYRCDSDSTAEVLHKQLQVLINRPENQKRFEELETRLGILPLPDRSTFQNHNDENFRRYNVYEKEKNQRKSHAKRFGSSMGSDTGNSTRESDCSEEHNRVSPISNSPSIAKQSLNNNELFDSLAAELRAKLNGNGPPILLPPRDYDTICRSKGNLTAIELRRCRNTLIVGAPPSSNTAHIGPRKQISSRGSSGIGSDLAPSPERQDVNSSSDDEHWSNEADNSVIAFKPSQIQIDKSNFIKKVQLTNRKLGTKSTGHDYLRDLPTKPYKIENNCCKEIVSNITTHQPKSESAWRQEDEIRPIIVRPIDYSAKFNQVIQTECNTNDLKANDKEIRNTQPTSKCKGNRLLKNNKLTESEFFNSHRTRQHMEEDSDPSSEQFQDDDCTVETNTSAHSKENLTDRQKFIKYSSEKNLKKLHISEIPLEQRSHNKFGAIHRKYSPDRSVNNHTNELKSDVEATTSQNIQKKIVKKDRNPYKEPDSIPYIESMEKLIKSSAYKSQDLSQKGFLIPDEMHNTKNFRKLEVIRTDIKYPKDKMTLKSSGNRYEDEEHYHSLIHQQSPHQAEWTQNNIRRKDYTNQEPKNDGHSKYLQNYSKENNIFKSEYNLNDRYGNDYAHYRNDWQAENFKNEHEPEEFLKDRLEIMENRKYKETAFKTSSPKSNDLPIRKKGFRHSYAEPVRVGLAAINPY